MVSLITLSQRFEQAIQASGGTPDTAIDISSKMREAFVQGDEHLQVVFPDRTAYLVRREVNMYSVFAMLADGLYPVIL